MDKHNFLLERATAGAGGAGQWERAACGTDPSGRACVFIKILKALRLPFKELTSVEKKNAMERFQAKHGD